MGAIIMGKPNLLHGRVAFGEGAPSCDTGLIKGKRVAFSATAAHVIQE